jgi:hypothetical protein
MAGSCSEAMVLAAWRPGTLLLPRLSSTQRQCLPPMLYLVYHLWLRGFPKFRLSSITILKHPLSSIGQLCQHQPIMFGASEDRARQLAYRKRRERVTSGSSASTYRSFSSASPVSQRFRVSSTLGEEGIQSYLATQRSSLHTGHSTIGHMNPLRFQADKASLSVTEAHVLQIERHRMERHRLQAEYLSQALCDSLSLAATSLQPGDASMSVMNSGRYGALGKPTMSRHVRSATAPLATLKMQVLPAPALNPPAELAALPLLHRTAHSAHLSTHTMVVLRGGDGGDDALPSQQQTVRPSSAVTNQAYGVTYNSRPLSAGGWKAYVSMAPVPQKILQFHNPGREYMLQTPWVQQFYNKPGWMVPISTGRQFQTFIHSLPVEWREVFVALFGPEQPPDHHLSPRANARRDFFQKLSPDLQLSFHGMIQWRVQELQKIEHGRHDLEFIGRVTGAPCAMLYHLMEASEPRILPDPSGYSDVALYTILMQASSVPLPQMDATTPLINSRPPRSSSAPNFGQFAQSHGYLLRALHRFLSDNLYRP